MVEDSTDIQYPDYNERKYDRNEMWNVYLAGIQVGLGQEGVSDEQSKEMFDDVMKYDIDESLHEAMKRPQLSIPPTQRELEQAFQQLSSMCTAYETMIEMKNERIEELEATLAMYEGKD